jgi:Xaa-Pro aminopeptidase
MNIYKERIDLLRKQMIAHGIDAYLINGNDPHLSEYVPERWKTRTFISGFSGSYGWLAITMNEAALWTDSRYYIQAEKQLQGSEIVMMKARLPNSVFVGDWISERLGYDNKVGFDGFCYSNAEAVLFENAFLKKNISIFHSIDLLEEIWENRPPIPSEKAFLHPIKWAGVSRMEKIGKIRNHIQSMNADYTLISSLDDLAWTFNIRGADIQYCPVVLGYAIIGMEKSLLFIHREKFSGEDISEIEADGIKIFPYETFLETLSSIHNAKFLIDLNKTSYSICKTISEKNRVVPASCIASFMKSQKCSSELNGFKQAMKFDAIAMLKAHYWLMQEISRSEISEFDFFNKLIDFRKEETTFKGPSFSPIVAYLDHGAVVHYEVTQESANLLKPEGLLLFDSGGQYSSGTTDITRTIALGPVTEQMKTDFTLVLKGMIALSSVKFPHGTMGCHLDVLARKPLWDHALNYGHGTGHGVGASLFVHEGPYSIRQDLNNHLLLPGFVLTNEPGIYKFGEYGIRIENMIHCIEYCENDFGKFYQFETLTLYPIDTTLIDRRIISENEKEWINNYHKVVYQKISPYIETPELILFLKELTKPI